MRVVLFHPRGHACRGGRRSIGSLAAVLAPLGLASIAAVLRQQGHRVSILDASLDTRLPNEEWVRRILSFHPDVVGFSAITAAFNDACDVCRKVKQCDAAITTVFGGVHASWGGATLLREHDCIDAIIAGEGEHAFARFCNGDNPAAIAGLQYRDGPAIRSAPPQERSSLCCMDELPFPAWDLVEGFPARYHLPLFSYPRAPGTHLVSSRGCVYQCSYCDRSVFNRTFRWNSPEYTFEQMRMLVADFGIRHVYFYDDLFTLNRERVERLCSLLRTAPFRVTFNCIVRIGHIDAELITLLKSAGCWMVNVGIESGDQAILDSHKEGLRIEDIRRDVWRLHRSGLYVKGLFMMGFPGETESSVRATIELACSLPLKDANITAFTPFPGAPITAEIERLGRFDNDWDKLDCMNVVFEPASLPDKAYLQRSYGEFIRRFYNRPFARHMYLRMLRDAPHSYLRLARNLQTFLGFARAV